MGRYANIYVIVVIDPLFLKIQLNSNFGRLGPRAFQKHITLRECILREKISSYLYCQNRLAPPLSLFPWTLMRSFFSDQKVPKKKVYYFQKRQKKVPHKLWPPCLRLRELQCI